MAEDQKKDIFKNAREFLKKGEYKDALQQLEAVERANPAKNPEIQALKDKLKFLKKEEDVIQRYMENKSYKNALGHIETILDDVNECRRVKILKAECFAHMNDYGKVEFFLKEIEGMDEQLEDIKLEIIYVKALMEFNKGNIKEAISIADGAMKIDKTHPKVKQLYYKAKYLQSQLEEAEKAVQIKSYQQAQILFSEVADIVNEANKNGENNRILAKILKSKAEISLKMQAYIDVIADCERMISYKEFLGEAYDYLAEAHIKTGGTTIAMNILSTALENKTVDAPTRARLEAKLKALQSKKQDEPQKELQAILVNYRTCTTPFEIAGVGADENTQKTDNILKKLSAKYNPDQFKSEDEKKVAEEIFKLVQEAKTKLKNEADENKRLKDLQSLNERLIKCKTPREVVEMPETGSKNEALGKIKSMIKKYHSDNFKTKQEKSIVEEIFKKVREAQETLSKEK